MNLNDFSLIHIFVFKASFKRSWHELKGLLGKSGLLGGTFSPNNLDGNIHFDIGSFIKKNINIEPEKGLSSHCTF